MMTTEDSSRTRVPAARPLGWWDLTASEGEAVKAGMRWLTESPWASPKVARFLRELADSYEEMHGTADAHQDHRDS